MASVRLCVLIAAGILASFFISSPRAETGPLFKFVSTEVTLSPRSVAGAPTVRLFLEGTQLPSDDSEPSGFVDGQNLQVEFTSIGTDPGKSKRYWQITAKFVSSERPAEGVRYVMFNYGGVTFTLPYKIIENKTPVIDWTIAPLIPDVALAPGDRFPIWIVTKDVAATNIRLARQSIHSDPGQDPLSGTWMLCDGPKDDAKCIESTSNPTATPFAIAANDAKDFWIKPPDGRLVGKYTGSFWISADQSKSGTALAVTFYESSTCRYIIGLAILVGSVIVAWFIGVWLRADVNKLQLERPFALLRSQQQAIAHEYEKLNAAISGSAETFARQLAALRENLKTANLKDVLGTGWPSAFGAAPQISDDYKSRLESLSNKTALLKKLMEEGLLVVNRMPTRPNATSVAEEIAGLSVGDAVTGDTAQKLADALARLHEPLGDALEAHFLARTAIQFREPTVQMIDLSLQSLSIVAWLVLAVVSVAMGWYLLILNHPGFGTYTDFFFCAAWGLGLPAGATGLASATTTTIATAFKIGT